MKIYEKRICTNLRIKEYNSYVLKVSAFLIMFFSFNIVFQTLAQEFSDKNETIEAMKVSFITKKLNLTATEAKVFWPVYNQYEDELALLQKNRRNMMNELKDDFSQISDTEIEKIIDEQVSFRQKEVDVIKKYHAEFKKVLSVKKIAKLYKAEEDFKRHLIRQIKN